jgi:hypothetical protein
MLMLALFSFAFAFSNPAGVTDLCSASSVLNNTGCTTAGNYKVSYTFMYGM